VGCTYHEQCSGTACDIETGACFDCTVDVNDGESISLAIEDDCVLIIHAGVYPESVQIGPGTKVALLAAEGEVAGITGVGLDNAPALDITGDAVVYVQDLRFTANDLGVGVSVDTGTLYLDRARVVSNAGGGLVLTNGASATVRNTFVGGSSADTAAIDVDGSTATIIYSTLVGYDDSFGGGTALRCTDPMMVVVRNSLIAKTGVGPEIECADASVSYTATEGATPGAGNVALTSITMGWFDDLAGGDYHLNAPPADLAMTAVWLTGDPSGDVDAEPRPAVDGSMDYAGADVPAK
jgi:hypothetical protein